MRLISATITGYGRLVDTKINLDSKVLAIVGPNEAGKTTLLKALSFIGNSAELSPTERSRAMEVTGETPVVSVRFVLDDDDYAAVSDIAVIELPRHMTASRQANGGNVRIGFDVEIKKEIKTLERALKVLRSAAKEEDLLESVSTETIYNDPGADSPHDFLGELNDLIIRIEGYLDQQEEIDENWTAATAEALRNVLVESEESKALRDALEEVEVWAVAKDPAEAMRSILWNERTPEFLLFEEGDRLLLSSYTIDDNLLGNMPAALSNILAIAALDLSVIQQYIQTGDIGRRDTAIEKANQRLSKLYENAWRQSVLSVKLSIDGTVLRINVIEDHETITVFDERSAGLRTFVALIAFLAAHGNKLPPILLIDEAENHLHIDAQADLVNMFMQQDRVAKVIYTTHSPACLPPDLGTGIRSVIPIPGTQESQIRNHFWTEGAGFSPLMIAMGAAAAAFTPARYVVLAEGATEMILLPSLLRSVVDADTIVYQVAPGLSEVPEDFYGSLDLEGARVAYLVDGDKGGTELKSKLLKHGVPGDKILQLPVPGLENLLTPDGYMNAVKALLLEQTDGSNLLKPLKLSAAPSKSWAKEVEAWVKSLDLTMPSKVAIANRIIEDNAAKPSKNHTKSLKQLHADLLAAFKLT